MKKSDLLNRIKTIINIIMYVLSILFFLATILCSIMKDDGYGFLLPMIVVGIIGLILSSIRITLYLKHKKIKIISTFIKWSHIIVLIIQYMMLCVLFSNTEIGKIISIPALVAVGLFIFWVILWNVIFPDNSRKYYKDPITGKQHWK